MVDGSSIYGQVKHLDAEQKFDAERLEGARERQNQGQIFGVDAFELAKAGAVDAIPGPERQFTRGSDGHLKDPIASALTRLGDKQQTYGDYLIIRTEAALNRGAPFPFAFASQGQLIGKQLTPAFITWAEAHSLSPNGASAAQIYDASGPVRLHRYPRSPRGVALLRRALASPNYSIQHAGASGLAMGSTGSLAGIVQACENAPAAMAELIALPLVAFSEPQAQIALQRFVKNRGLLDSQRDAFKKYGLDGLL
jgi:hypothetical protein